MQRGIEDQDCVLKSPLLGLGRCAVIFLESIDDCNDHLERKISMDHDVE